MMTANVTETGSGVNRVCVSYSGGAFAFVLCLGSGYNNPFTVSRNGTRKQHCWIPGALLDARAPR